MDMNIVIHMSSNTDLHFVYLSWTFGKCDFTDEELK